MKVFAYFFSLLLISGIAIASAEMAEQPQNDNAETPQAVENTICPVSGMKIGEMGSGVEYEHEGKIYLFCCVDCIEPFKADPDKYLSSLREQMKDEQAVKKPSAMNSLEEGGLEMRQYEVYGMDCPGCHQGLEKLVRKVPEVQDAKANWDKQLLTVYLDAGESLDDEAIYDAIERANFTVGERIK